MNYGLGNHENLLKIAKSGHPRALTVLRELNARDPRGTWEDLTEQYGYPIPTYRGPITVNQKALETALAAAGDREAFDKIAKNFLGIGIDEEQEGGVRKDAMWQLIDIDSEAAVAVIGSQLDNDEYRMGTPPKGYEFLKEEEPEVIQSIDKDAVEETDKGCNDPHQRDPMESFS